MHFHTGEHGFDVPGWDGVNEGVHIEHDYGDGEAVGVSLHGAGVGVVPLDTHTLFLILREILAAKAKGHRGQEALRKRGQHTSIRPQGQKLFELQASLFGHSRRRPGSWCWADLSRPRTARRAGTERSIWVRHRPRPGWLWKRRCWWGSTAWWWQWRTPSGRKTPQTGRCKAGCRPTGREGKKRLHTQRGETVQFSACCCRCCRRRVTLSRAMRSPADTMKGTRLLMNQLSHRVPVPRPMILMVSFSLASFSYTIPLMIMATE